MSSPVLPQISAVSRTQGQLHLPIKVLPIPHHKFMLFLRLVPKRDEERHAKPDGSPNFPDEEAGPASVRREDSIGDNNSRDGIHESQLVIGFDWVIQVILGLEDLIELIYRNTASGNC